MGCNTIRFPRRPSFQRDVLFPTTNLVPHRCRYGVSRSEEELANRVVAPYTFDADQLKRQDFTPFCPVRGGIDYKTIDEDAATIDFKVSRQAASNLFEGGQTILMDIPVGSATRIRFDRTRDHFRFLRIRFDKHTIEQIDIPVMGCSKEKAMYLDKQFEVSLTWDQQRIGLSIGNTDFPNYTRTILFLDGRVQCF